MKLLLNSIYTSSATRFYQLQVSSSTDLKPSGIIFGLVECFGDGNFDLLPSSERVENLGKNGVRHHGPLKKQNVVAGWQLKNVL